MGNNNTKPENIIHTSVNPENDISTDNPKIFTEPYQIPKEPEKQESKPDYDELKRQNSLISKIKIQEPIINTAKQSFKPKKFDKEKFKLANQPSKSVESVSAVISTNLMDDEDEKLMNLILNKI
jgi:hypothetical protein